VFVAKENVKTASYGGVIVFGVGVTCAIFYTVFKELFSGESPNKLFQKASDQCVADPRVQDMLGEPIKAFGEETRRGRRRHVR
jgi:import inner membrane translocase subunit TIM21